MVKINQSKPPGRRYGQGGLYQCADIQQLFEQAGHVLEYLPPDSPDFNPLGRKWAQAKATRKQQQCSVEELFVILC